MDDSRPNSRTVPVVLALTLLSLAIYTQTSRFDFVNLDDPAYVSDNPRVLGGLSVDGVRWAFQSTEEANWHPLTWLSLMLDSEIGGGSPRIYHATNVAFHIVTSVLLYLALFRLTTCRWRSAFVAALFAVHPLHVESVAWISERKDVLSATFWMLTLLAYVRYARSPRVATYLPVLATFVLGLMAKPMLVTLPVTLVLLDYWPLGRLHWPPRKSDRPALLDKLPLLLLSGVSAAVTLYAQSAGGAVNTLESISLGARAGNAFVSYAGYIGKTLWPFGLAAFYPHPAESPALWRVAACLLVLAALSWLAARSWSRYPYLGVGWAWYLVTLLPVIGFVQVGVQGMADRYMYIPMIGLLIAGVWGAADLARRIGRPEASKFAGGVAGVVVLLLAVRAWDQTRHWKNGVALFEHALRVTEDNSRAHNGLGMALGTAGRRDEAIAQFRLAVASDPNYALAHSNLAGALALEGRFDEASAGFRRATELSPRDATILANAGTALMRQGRLKEAAAMLTRAVEIDPDRRQAQKNLGVVLARLGDLDGAIRHFGEALRIDPEDEGARANLERARQLRRGSD